VSLAAGAEVAGVELRQLRYFVTLAEELHFGRAAERLMVAQPALSQQIKQLENELGVRLLERNRRRVTLTDAGRTFLKDAKDILARSEAAIRAAQWTRRGQVGSLVVGFNSGALADLLPATVRAFRRRFNRVQVVLREMTTPEQAIALRERRIDLGFLCPPVPPSDERLLHIESLLREPLVLALPRRHPLVRRRRVPLADLADEDFVMCRDDVGYCAQVRDICRAAGFEPRIAQAADEGETAMALVEAGVGVSLMPAWWRRKLRRPGVIIRELDDATEAATVEMAMAWRKDTPSLPLQNFIETAREVRSEAANKSAGNRRE
jgi:DNA-binding transcriptional LysR family regulator